MTLASGRVLACHVPHARGSRERPMSDAEIDTKFIALAAPVLGDARAATLLAACRGMPAQDAGWLHTLPALARP